MKKEFGVTDRLGFVGTLHAFCLRLIREHCGALGLPPLIVVADDDQREDFLESVRNDMGIKCSAKKALELLDDSEGYDPRGIPTKAGLLVKEYHSRLRRAGMPDFDMVLRYGLAWAEIADENEWPYSCLFWDEMQDSTDQDTRFLLAAPCCEKMLVGDPDQAIFGFRGGNVGNMLRLPLNLSRLYDMKTVRLESNYRSGSVICYHAQQLIMHNTSRIAKWTRPIRTGGTAVAVKCATPFEELAYVLQQVGNRPPSVTAVLARTNKLVDSFAQHLAANGIPVRKAKAIEEPKDWRRTKLLLTVLDNPWNDLSVIQLVKMDKIADAGTTKLNAAKEMCSVNEVLGFPYGKGEGFAADIDLVKHGVSPESRERVHNACRELSKHGEWTIADLLLYLGRLDNAVQEEGTGVTCTTIHSAKGREFCNVFIVGCEEGNLPSIRKDTEIEEERRLAYVAMTRAADSVVMTWCAARPQNRGPNAPPGPMEPREPSRFIKEAGL